MAVESDPLKQEIHDLRNQIMNKELELLILHKDLGRIYAALGELLKRMDLAE